MGGRAVAVLGVNAVILGSDGRVLLALRDRPPIWNLPGGSVEPGETPWDAAVREVREEVGLDVAVDRLAGVYDRSPDGDPVLVFACRVFSGEPATSAEAVRVDWFDPSDLPSAINPYQPQRIADAVGAGPAAVLRHQPGPAVRELYPDP
ncbi:MAG: NUDIX domain-containing protein [Geodermatophilaceae bacterium]|nr:NUDIX domain-containing protein [Geodermatophilaceae bacterium]